MKIIIDNQLLDNKYYRIKYHLLEMDQQIIPPLSDRVDISNYSMKIALNGFQVFAYEKKDFGHCFFYKHKKDYIYITSFGVLKEVRKQKIGQRLMDKTKSICRQEKIKKITLQVSINNTSALLFYKKQGFQVINKIDEWFIMECILDFS